MDFGVASSITAALTRLTQNQEYGYAAREGVLAEAFVRRMERRFGWHTDPADTLAVGDLVQASFSSVMAFSEPGDAVLLQLPSYPPFMRAIEDTGRRLIANPMRDDGTRWVLDLDAYEAAPDPHTRMLIFCHPQNPTGRAYSRAELEAVAAFAIRHDLVVVSDEIHADIVYPGNSHMPLASLHPEIAARTITITSATKSFNIPALRCAVMHFGSPFPHRFGDGIEISVVGNRGQGICFRNRAILQKACDNPAARFEQCVFSSEQITFHAVVQHVGHELADHAITLLLPKSAKPVGFSASVVVTSVVGISARAVDDKFTKRAVGEVQHIPVAHSEKLFKLAFF